MPPISFFSLLLLIEETFEKGGSSSGSLWNSSIGIKKYGKKNYYKYKNKIRSVNHSNNQKRK